MSSALTASCPCIFFCTSKGGDGDGERVVTSVADEFGVLSALVDIEDTVAEETVVLAVEAAELVSGLVAFEADGRWTTIY